MSCDAVKAASAAQRRIILSYCANSFGCILLLLFISVVSISVLQGQNLFLIQTEPIKLIAAIAVLAILLIFVLTFFVFQPAAKKFTAAHNSIESINRARAEFLASQSHEIRTPIGGITGIAEIILTTSLTQQQRAHIKMLQNSADHLLGIINNILDISKLEAGQMELQQQKFSLLSAAEDVVSILSVKAQEKNIELILNYSPGAPEKINGDAGRIKQVLFNLLGNAIKFTDSGYVMLHIKAVESGMLEIKVEDTGIGIAEHKLPLLFERFVQVSEGGRAHQGTGLGLAITQDIIRLMGGDITAISSPGYGSAFICRIPLSWSGNVFSYPSAHTILPGLRVLLVEPLAPNREIYGNILAAAGIEYLAAETYEEAESILKYEKNRGRKLDLIIADHKIKILPQDDMQVITLTSVAAAIPQKNAVALTRPVSAVQLINAIENIFSSNAAQLDLPDVPQPQAKTLKGINILLAEDNKVNSEIITFMLKSMGCNVACAVNGKEAIEKLMLQNFDVMLTDCQMPVMDGFEAMTHILRMRAVGQIPYVPVIALTANATDHDRELCLKSGMDDYLCKPVPKAELHAMLLKHLPLATLSLGNIATQNLTQGNVPAGVDMSAFIAMRELLGSRMATIIGYFLEDAEKYISDIEGAIKQGDARALLRPAHTLKSSSRQLGVVVMADLAEKLEKEAANTNGMLDRDKVRSMVTPLKHALEDMTIFLRANAR